MPNVIIHPLPPAEARLRHDLGILLKNVESTWIKGVLESSLQEGALLELAMELRNEAVDNPWRMVLEGPDEARGTFPRNKNIKEIFHESNGLLLILGEAGSGKTTTLLQLAGELIADVDNAFTSPVPVILNLASWSNSRQTIAEWLVAELNIKYRVPIRDGKNWLEGRRILPLLDGLDEVVSERRAACVASINEFVMAFGLLGLVVTSRTAEYMNLPIRLAFYTAVVIKPLTIDQVDQYLESAGHQFSELRKILQEDTSLRELAQSPLMLSIMTLAYKDSSAEKIANMPLGSAEARRKHLFDTYIQRVFLRRAYEEERYPREQTIHWLSWLAQQMLEHSQNIFLVEGLQPSWLQSVRDRKIYRLATKLISGLICGLGFLVIGAMLGLMVGNPSSSAIGGLIGLLVGGIIGVVICGINDQEIRTVEALAWSWKQAKDGGLLGMKAGLKFGLIGGIMGGIIGNFIDNFGKGLTLGLAIGLAYGIFSSLTGGLIFGLRDVQLESRSMPNQGIWLSFKNFGLVWLITLFFLAPLFCLVFGLLYGMTFGILLGLSSSILIGLVFGMLFGGKAVIQHFTLRLIQYKRGFAPLNYPDFLNYASDRILLRRVGGGYIFVARPLMDYFANRTGTT